MFKIILYEFFYLLLLQSWESNGQFSDLVDNVTGKGIDSLYELNIKPNQSLNNDQNAQMPDIAKDVSFWCRDRVTGEDRQVSVNNTTEFKNESIVFLIHGWVNSRTTKWMNETIRDFIIFVPDIKVCAVDWSRLAYYEYEIAAKRNVYAVGIYCAEAFKRWNLNLNLLTLVGHSLGAQVAGKIGKILNGLLQTIFGELIFKIRMILKFYLNSLVFSALDLAGPILCQPIPKSDRLESSDAKYVQVHSSMCILTSSGSFGCVLNSGDATFYPNGGIAPQPPCPLTGTGPDNFLLCSHNYATVLFRLSLNPAIIFRSCSSYYFNFSGNWFCVGTEDRMGWYASGKSGNFFLTTT